LTLFIVYDKINLDIWLASEPPPEGVEMKALAFIPTIAAFVGLAAEQIYYQQWHWAVVNGFLALFLIAFMCTMILRDAIERSR